MSRLQPRLARRSPHLPALAASHLEPVWRFTSRQMPIATPTTATVLNIRIAYKSRIQVKWRCRLRKPQGSGIVLG